MFVVMRGGWVGLAVVAAAAACASCGRVGVQPGVQVGVGGPLGPQLSTNVGLLITMKGTRFNPPELVVPRGSRVSWTNQDDVMHNVTGLGESRFDSDVQPRGTVTHTFGKSGRHEYVCTLHPSMRGYIVVE